MCFRNNASPTFRNNSSKFIFKSQSDATPTTLYEFCRSMESCPLILVPHVNSKMTAALCVGAHCNNQHWICMKDKRKGKSRSYSEKQLWCRLPFARAGLSLYFLLGLTPALSFHNYYAEFSSDNRVFRSTINAETEMSGQTEFLVFIYRSSDYFFKGDVVKCCKRFLHQRNALTNWFEWVNFQGLDRQNAWMITSVFFTLQFRAFGL